VYLLRKGNMILIPGSKEQLAVLGNKLKALRLEANLIQKRVSEKTGIDGATISQIENGKNTSSLYLIKLLDTYSRYGDFSSVISTPDISPMQLLKSAKKKKYASSEKSKYT